MNVASQRFSRKITLLRVCSTINMFSNRKNNFCEHLSNFQPVNSDLTQICAFLDDVGTKQHPLVGTKQHRIYFCKN